MAQGFVRASSGLAVSRDQALVELAKAARDVLLEVAATYRATISYKQLAVDTQRRAAIRAGTTPGWLVDTLAMVVHVCHRLAEPPLTSLVVNHEDGRVGSAYDEVLTTAGLPLLDADARERAAAASRLECYRRFAPGVPEDAVPTLVSVAAAQRTPSVRASRAGRASGTSTGRAASGAGRTAAAPVRATPRSKPIDPTKKWAAEDSRAAYVLCPSCFLQTPPGAECQNCGAPLR